MSGEQECDRRRLLGVSLGGSRKGAPMCRYLPAHICPTPPQPRHPPLNGTLALDHLLFLHAWVALVARVEKRKGRKRGGKKKTRRTVSHLSSPWHFDVSSVIARGLWTLSPLEGFDMKSRPGLSGLSHGQWSRTKTISRLTVGYYYRGEWGTEDGWGGAPSAMKRTFLPSWEHIRRPPLIELDQSTPALIDFNLKFVQTVDFGIDWRPAGEYSLACLHRGGTAETVGNEF